MNLFKINFLIFISSVSSEAYFLSERCCNYIMWYNVMLTYYNLVPIYPVNLHLYLQIEGKSSFRCDGPTKPLGAAEFLHLMFAKCPAMKQLDITRLHVTKA